MDNDQQTPAWAHQLLTRLAAVESSLNTSPLVSNDPNVTIRAPGADFSPSAALLERCPYIQEDFFRQPLPESERRRFLFECPKNKSREYKPPKLNKVQMSQSAKTYDSQLHHIQYRLSGLTRPLDWFAYRLLHHNWSDQDTRTHSLALVQAIHELLSDLASHVTQLLTDNMFKGIAGNMDVPATSSQDFLMDPKEMVEHFKLQQSVKQATSGGGRRKNHRPRSQRSHQQESSSTASNFSNPANYNRPTFHQSGTTSSQPTSNTSSSGFQQRSNHQKRN